MVRSSAVKLLLILVSAGGVVSGNDPVTRIQAGHNLLIEEEAGSVIVPGNVISDASFRDTSGKACYLAETVANGPAVFVFLSTKCPLAKRYTMRLKRLSEQYADQGVRIFGVFSNSDETTAGVQAYAAAADYPFPVVRDNQAWLAGHLGATMTPQVFLLDRNMVLRYRGAIDDHRYENRVKETYLTDALDAVLAGTEVQVSTVDAMGCTIHTSDASEEGEVTYSEHVARILQNNCQSCHRDGQVAPFSLVSYDEAKRWQTEIQKYTQLRLMPPWKAVPGFADYRNDISLTDEEISLITKWVEQGAPPGSADEIPPSPKFSDDWAFGEPDLIVEMPEEYVIGPEGEDDYRHFIIPYKSDQHRFVEAVDVRPGNRNVVHHVIGYADTSGKARRLDAADEGPGYTRFGDVGFDPASVVGGWAPGSLPIRTPSGTGRWLPKECDIVLQVHYYRTGIQERDRTKIGLYFSKDPEPVPTQIGMVINTDFVVTPGDANYEVRAEYTVKESSFLYEVTPHMHLIGQTMVVTAHRPDGSVIPIVKIDDWDFNWQNSYYFRELQYLPAGTKVKLTATFDNSAANPNNPHSPPQPIGWGEKTTDEMCIAFLGLLHESEYDPKTKRRRAEPLAQRLKTVK